MNRRGCSRFEPRRWSSATAGEVRRYEDCTLFVQFQAREFVDLLANPGHVAFEWGGGYAPPPSGPVLRPTHHAPAVGMEGGAEDRVGVVQRRAELQARLHVPESRGGVEAGRQQGRPVGAEGERGDFSRVAAEVVEE